MIELFTTYVKATGQILTTGTSACPHLFDTEEIGVLIGQQVNGDLFYVSDDLSVLSKGNPTTPNLTFDYVSKAWVDTNTRQIEDFQARLKRSILLSESDWTQLPDVPLVTRVPWTTYRQALRDITEQSGYPTEIVWPVTP